PSSSRIYKPCLPACTYDEPSGRMPTRNPVTPTEVPMPPLERLSLIGPTDTDFLRYHAIVIPPSFLRGPYFFLLPNARLTRRFGAAKRRKIGRRAADC